MVLAHLHGFNDETTEAWIGFGEANASTVYYLLLFSRLQRLRRPYQCRQLVSCFLGGGGGLEWAGNLSPPKSHRWLGELEDITDDEEYGVRLPRSNVRTGN